MEFTSTIFYKIDLSFSIKLQEINLYKCEEYKTECEAQRSNISERKVRRLNRAPQARSNLRIAHDENIATKRADFLKLRCFGHMNESRFLSVYTKKLFIAIYIIYFIMIFLKNNRNLGKIEMQW